MLAVYLCYLLVDISQLHMVAIHLVIIHHLVYLLDPLLVKEHRVVSISYYLFTIYEFVILGLHLVSQSLNVALLLDPPLPTCQRSQNRAELRRIIAEHVLNNL